MSKTKTKLVLATLALAALLPCQVAQAQSDPLAELFKSSATNATAQAQLADVTGLAAVAASGSVNLTWTAVTGADSYTIYYGPKSVVAKAANSYETEVLVGNVTSYTISGLTSGQIYYFALAAEDSTGRSKGSNNYSTEVSATPTAAAKATTPTVTPTATAAKPTTTPTPTATQPATSPAVTTPTATPVTTPNITPVTTPAEATAATPQVTDTFAAAAGANTNFESAAAEHTAAETPEDLAKSGPEVLWLVGLAGTAAAALRRRYFSRL